MIIKATRLQHGRSQGEGHEQAVTLPLENFIFCYSILAEAFLLFFFIWGPFCYVFLILGGLFAMWGPFCYVFLILGGLFAMWGPFCYFLLHGGSLCWGLPPPLRKFLRAPMIARRFREHAPRKFLCDRNLVSSEHVL